MDNVRYDCIISAGEIDPKHFGKFLDNEMRVTEVVKHNVTGEEVQEWLKSRERLERVFELERIGREKFGCDSWMKYDVNSYFTLAHKD